MHSFYIITVLIHAHIAYSAVLNPAYHRNAIHVANPQGVSASYLNSSYPSVPSKPPRRDTNSPKWTSELRRQPTTPSSSALRRKRTPTTPDARATPAPTGDPSPLRTIHIFDDKNFSLLAPQDPKLRTRAMKEIGTRSAESISDAESDAVSYCSPGAAAAGATCPKVLPDGFIAASSLKRSPDNAWIQARSSQDPAAEL